MKELRTSENRAVTVSAYSPHVNGRAELMIQTCERKLIRMVPQDSNERQSALETLESSYRVRPMADGLSPFWLMDGPQGRIRTHARVEQNCVAHLDNDTLTHSTPWEHRPSSRLVLLGIEEHRRNKTVPTSALMKSFSVGVMVTVKSPHQNKAKVFCPNWTGPFVVCKVQGLRSLLKNGEGQVTKRRTHTRRLKRDFSGGIAGDPWDQITYQTTLLQDVSSLAGTLLFLYGGGCEAVQSCCDECGAGRAS